MPPRSRLTCAAVFVVLAAGCGGQPARQATYPVSGSVTVGGKPAAGAKIFFHPAAQAGERNALRPIAEAGDDGTFRLTTFLKNDGAPAGEYIVTLTWPAVRAGAADDGRPNPDRLGGRYATPDKSPLRATVTAGTNTLEPFRLP